MSEENNKDEKRNTKSVVLDFVKQHKRKLIVLGVGGTIAAINLLDPSIAAPIMTTLTSLAAAEGLYKIFGGSDDKKKETRVESTQTTENGITKKSTLAPAMVNEVAESEIAGNMQSVKSEEKSKFHVDKNNDARHLFTTVAKNFCDECVARGVAIKDGCNKLAEWASAGMVMEQEAVMGLS